MPERWGMRDCGTTSVPLVGKSSPSVGKSAGVVCIMSQTPMPPSFRPNPPQPGMPPQLPDGSKKGLSTWGKVGIGCGVMLILGVILLGFGIKACTEKFNEFRAEMEKNPEKKMAEFVISADTDFTVVQTNDVTGEMTIREKKTGKEFTLSYKDVLNGKHALQATTDGQVEVGTIEEKDLPAWAPLPDAAVVASGYKKVVDGKVSGVVVFTTSGGAEEIIAFYDAATKDWPVRSTESSNETLGTRQQAKMRITDDVRELDLVVLEVGTETTVTLKFREE